MIRHIIFFCKCYTIVDYVVVLSSSNVISQLTPKIRYLMQISRSFDF